MSFLRTWFSGYADALDGLDADARKAVLRPCAVVCSDSYPVEIVRDAAAGATTIAEFWRAVEAAMADIRVVDVASRSAVLTFVRCGCDLVTGGYVSTPSLCECSRLSVTHTLESVFGPGSVEVSLLATILGGADVCRLLVRFVDDPGTVLAR